MTTTPSAVATVACEEGTQEKPAVVQPSPAPAPNVQTAPEETVPAAEVVQETVATATTQENEVESARGTKALAALKAASDELKAKEEAFEVTITPEAAPGWEVTWKPRANTQAAKGDFYFRSSSCGNLLRSCADVSRLMEAARGGESGGSESPAMLVIPMGFNASKLSHVLYYANAK